MTQELTPNTQITQANVGLLKAGDWLHHERGPIGQLARVTSSHIYMSRDGLPDIGDRHQGFTYIGPDIGDGWIGWSGGENPVPGMRVEVRYNDHEVLSGRAGGFKWRRRSELGWSNIIAFRPALSPPAEGEGRVKKTAENEHVPATCKQSLQVPPTPAPVDWERVGPKLVEALERIEANDANDPAQPWTVARAALAAAQPEGK